MEQNKDDEKEYEIEDAEKNNDNKEFMLKALDDGATWVIAYCSDRLFSDRELMLKAVKKDGQLLYYASKELRDDKEVVLAAVSNKGIIIKYASKRLREDEEVVKAALENNKASEIYISEELRKKLEEENEES